MKDLDWEWARLMNEIMDAEWEHERRVNALKDAHANLQGYINETYGKPGFDPEWHDQLRNDYEEAFHQMRESREALNALREEEAKAGYSVTFELTDEPPSFLRD